MYIAHAIFPKIRNTQVLSKVSQKKKKKKKSKRRRILRNRETVVENSQGFDRDDDDNNNNTRTVEYTHTHTHSTVGDGGPNRSHTEEEEEARSHRERDVIKIKEKENKSNRCRNRSPHGLKCCCCCCCRPNNLFGVRLKLNSTCCIGRRRSPTLISFSFLSSQRQQQQWQIGNDDTQLLCHTHGTRTTSFFFSFISSQKGSDYCAVVVFHFPTIVMLLLL